MCSILPTNVYTRRSTFELADLDTLPKLDSQRPKPGPDTVPSLFHASFTQWSAATAQHFRFNSVLQASLERTLWEHGLDKPRSVPTVGYDRPFCGDCCSVLWPTPARPAAYTGEAATNLRPNATLAHKSAGTLRALMVVYRIVLISSTNSGNVTLHCDTALDSLQTVAEQYPAFDRDKSKARLLLMTAEPDGLDLFRADPLCRRHFDIHELSRGGTDKPFLQSEFRNLPHDERLADTKRMLVQVEVLANFVDTTVVSANSNTGRSLIMLRGGPARTINEYRIRSVDVYWHVGSYLFFMQPPR